MDENKAQPAQSANVVHLGLGAVGTIVAIVAIFAMISVAGSLKNLANKNLIANYNGTFSTGSYEYPEVMAIETLLDYIGIYPDIKYDNIVEYPAPEYNDDGTAAVPIPAPESQYDIEYAKWFADIEAKITLGSGGWAGFPYLRLEGELRFSKTAVDAWLAQGGTSGSIKDELGSGITPYAGNANG